VVAPIEAKGHQTSRDAIDQRIELSVIAAEARLRKHQRVSIAESTGRLAQDLADHEVIDPSRMPIVHDEPSPSVFDRIFR